MKTLFIVTGQTATGKTNYAVNLAKQQNGELVICDSRQIYKHLDIVTGKDLPILHQSKLLYHLIDIVDPKETFSSFDFVKAATAVINDIFNRNKTPIVVGGTYFYIKHLLYGVDMHVEPDEDLRKNLEKKSVEELQKELISLDKWVYFKMNNSDKNNPRRLVRRIEILKSGEGAKEHKTAVNEWSKIKMFGLKHSSKAQLVGAITHRVKERMALGAVEEVKNLLKMGYSKEDPGLQTIGYQQLIEFIEGKLTEEEAIEQWITKEVQYAKRQYTFMKTNGDIRWIIFS